MRKILVVATMTHGTVDDGTWEAGTAARRIAAESGGAVGVNAILLGSGIGEAADELSRWFDDVIVVDDASLDAPDGDLYADTVAAAVEREQPELVLLSHTNFAMDLAPRLAERTGRTLLSDCLSVEVKDEAVFVTRTMYAGKVHARMRADAGRECVITVRPGAFGVPESAPESGGAIRREAMPEDVSPRRKYVRTVTPEAEDVDISQSDVLVAVGRGIEEQENMEMIESLAAALGADVACSRPVVDKKWLPKTRQVGTSGVTVKPKVYIAVGISGSFQHMGGVKGNPYIAAVNSDPRAPIFSVADVGIVGDLFDIVPLLTDKIRALKS